MSKIRFTLLRCNFKRGEAECDGIFTLCIYFLKLSWSEKLVTDFSKALGRCLHSKDGLSFPKFRITVLCGGTSRGFEEPAVSEETAVSIFNLPALRH